MDKYISVASKVLKEMVNQPHEGAWQLITTITDEEGISLTRKEKVFVRDLIFTSIRTLSKLEV